MDAEHALADLMEISSQVEAAVVLGPEGSVEASTLAASSRSERLAAAARELLDGAAAARSSGGGPVPTEVGVTTRRGSVFVVRAAHATIVAATPPGATAGLVLYDLRTALRQLEDGPPEPKARRRRRTAKAADEAA